MTSIATRPPEQTSAPTADTGRAIAPPDGAVSPWVSVWTRTAWIAAVFCLLVSGTMLYFHFTALEHDPWQSPRLLELKAQLRAAPNDENIKREIRRLDLEFRQRYRRRLVLDRTGGWLLIGGLAVMVAAARQAARLRAAPPMPKPDPTAALRARAEAARARRAAAALGGVVFAGLAALMLTARSPLPKSAVELEKLLAGPGAESGPSDALPWELFRLQWPQFRGPDGSGVSLFTNVPLSWDAVAGANLLWKSPVPASGHSSPVVWSNRVFVSGGDAARREVFCFDAADGALLWRRAVENVPGSPATPPEIPEMTGFASPTMACDGRRVFVLFANGDLAAFTLEGAPVWAKNIGVPKNTYGHATSPVIRPGRLLVQLDQDEGAPGGSKLLAFDPATGRPLWETRKPTHSSWATPIVIEAAGKTQIVTLAVPFVMSFAVDDGRELWRAELLAGEVTPSPVFAAGLVFAVNPSTELLALRPDGTGDVTQSHVVWRASDNVPDVTSPVSNGELVFTVTSGGVLTCVDARDGRKLWEAALEIEAQASPAIVGEKLFVLGLRGDAVVVEAARAFRELARSRLPDQFLASPAFADGRMFLRGETNLWCIGTKPSP
jgi:outer membrane protein assembly factor BamB